MKQEGNLEMYPSIYQSYMLPKKAELSMSSRLFQSILVSDINKANTLFIHINEFVVSHNAAENKISRYSGLLMAKDNLLILFLENNNHNINEFLRWLKNLISPYESEVKSTILAFNEEFSNRVFEYWGSEKVVNPIVPKFDSEKTEQETEQIVWEAYQKFLTAGNSISKKLKEEGKFTQPLIKEAINYIQLNVDEFSLLINDHYPSLSDYFQIYYSQEEVRLDAQNVWPAENYISQLIEYSKHPYDQYNGVR
jgi:hypothetical protein